MNDIKEIMAAAWILDIQVNRSIYVTSEDAKIAAQFQLERLAEAGFVIAPKEPSRKMLEAGDNEAFNLNVENVPAGSYFLTIYKAMINASQGGDM